MGVTLKLAQEISDSLLDSTFGESRLIRGIMERPSKVATECSGILGYALLVPVAGRERG